MLWMSIDLRLVTFLFNPNANLGFWDLVFPCIHNSSINPHLDQPKSHNPHSLMLPLSLCGKLFWKWGIGAYKFQWTIPIGDGKLVLASRLMWDSPRHTPFMRNIFNKTLRKGWPFLCTMFGIKALSFDSSHYTTSLELPSPLVNDKDVYKNLFFNFLKFFTWKKFAYLK